MRQLLVILGLLLGLLQPFAGLQPARAIDTRGVEIDVQRGMEEILTLWRDGRYEELYQRTSGGKMTREAFVKRFAGASLKPTCCWDKLQEVRVTVQTASRATLYGTVGLESTVGSETKTKSFKMSRESGVWLINQNELVSLAGAPHQKKKKRVVSKHP